MVHRFVILGSAVACVLAACTSSSPSPPADAGSSGGGIDGATPPGTPPSAGACASGNPRPPASMIQALSLLVGTWAVTPADDTENNKRTLVFGESSVDVGCFYADQGFIEMDYLQVNAPSTTCTRDRYHLRILQNGAATNGSYTGERKGLLPDGGPNLQPELGSSWTFEGGVLYFDSQHYTGGGGLSCP
jgi:hypothetical protein